MSGKLLNHVSGYRGLMLAVLYRAAMDLRGSSPKMKADAAEFFESDWYVDICDFLDLPPGARPIMED